MRHSTSCLCAFLVFSTSVAYAAGMQSLRSFDAAAVTPARVAREAGDSAPGDLFRIAGLRGAAGETLTLALERAPLFAADFHLYVDGRDRGRDAVARLSFLRGTVEEWPGSSVALLLDGAKGAWSGLLVTGDQVYEVALPAGATHSAIAESIVVRQAAVEPLGESFVSDVLEPPRGLEQAGVLGFEKIIAAPGSEYEATIAIDSDFEFFQLYGSEERATGHIASVMAAVSEVYFRQLGVALTISSLSLYTSADDPWNAPSPHSGERADVLCEFSSFWQSSRPLSAFPRNGAVFFTGKPSADIGGQAWRGGLCSFNARPSSCPFGGYGIVVTSQREARDSYLAAHELGHVFSSQHTHCYNPPIDQCFSGEGRCYEGPVSSPPDGGSVMSYCLPFSLSLGEPGRFGVDSQRVVQFMRSFVDRVGPQCLRRTADGYALAGEAGRGSVTLTWKDPFGSEFKWIVEQRLPSGKFKQVKLLPANSTGVTLTRIKRGPATFRVRAKFKRDFSDYSSAVTVIVL
jgi:hypothetical protein